MTREFRGVLLGWVGLSLLPAQAPLPKNSAAFRAHVVQGVASTRQVGDLDALVKKRWIKVLVIHNRTDYFLDRGRPHGWAYEMAAAFQAHLNKRYAKPKQPIRVQVIPVGRDEIVPALAAGRADVAMAPTKAIPEHSAQVDFSQPLYDKVDELLVSHASVPQPSSLLDLSGMTVFVRRSSAYHRSLEALNAWLAGEGRAPVHIRDAPEQLNDDDILELVDAGVVDHTILDSFKVPLLASVFRNVRVDFDVRLREHVSIACALRKGTPRLQAEVNAFLTTHGLGTSFGNTLARRYYVTNRWLRSSVSHDDTQRYDQLAGLFRKYGQRYGIDPMLLVAQGYQESGLDHSRRSPVGAVGVMQVMPSTGKSLKVGDIHQVEPNIHAGAKYLRTLMDAHVNEPGIDPINQALLAFASYNAGPGAIHRMRKLAAQRSLDPNRWFDHVELVTSERIGRETVTYVSNINNYFLAFTLLEEHRARQEAAEAALRQGAERPR